MFSKAKSCLIMLAAAYAVLSSVSVQRAAADFIEGGDLVLDVTIDSTNYRMHVFTNIGTNSLTVNADGTVDYMVVAGGGAAVAGAVAAAAAPAA
ncbi:MAG: hypothetical protein ABR497_11095 [Kiritimatiellia bacterium]